jgi:hypothetical protein
VTLSLKKVPAEMVLDLILRQLKLDYRLRNGVVMVASSADVQAQTEVRVYRVREGMAEELAALIPATIDANLWSEHTVFVDPHGRRRAGYGSTGAMSSGGGYGAPGYGGSRGGYGAAPAPGEAIESVGGGGSGTIRAFRGTLVISQTPEVHQKIEKLLIGLERAGAMDPQKRSDGPGVDRTGMMPAPQTQGPGSGQPGYGQVGGRARTGYGGSSGDGASGRGGHGGYGGARGGYGSGGAGYGTAGPSEDGGRAGGERRRGRGAAGEAAPEGGSPLGLPPSSGGSAPVPLDPSGASDATLGPSAPGGQPQGTNDPNAAEAGTAAPTNTPPAGAYGGAR